MGGTYRWRLAAQRRQPPGTPQDGLGEASRSMVSEATVPWAVITTTPKIARTRRIEALGCRDCSKAVLDACVMGVSEAHNEPVALNDTTCLMELTREARHESRTEGRRSRLNLGHEHSGAPAGGTTWGRAQLDRTKTHGLTFGQSTRPDTYHLTRPDTDVF